MAEIINISIDLTKIDKSKIKEVTLKSGNKAKFLDLTVFIKDEQDQYGNIASVSLGQTKEERDAAEPKVYIGNGKRTWASTAAPKKEEAKTDEGFTNDDLPF